MKTIATIFLVLLVFIAACGGPQETTTTAPDVSTITIGGMHPLTGGGAAYGIPIQRATEIAVAEINDAGGINGQILKIIWEDSKCAPKDGATAARKLVDVDNVDVILGGVCSGETLAAAPITEEAGVILLAPSATSADITDAGDYVFRTAPSDAFAAKIAAEYAWAQGYKTMAIVSENSDYAQGLRQVFRDNYKALGGSVAIQESYDPKSSDFKTIALKIVGVYPDAVYVAPQTPDKGLLLVKQIRENAYEEPLITAEVLIGRNIIKENAELLEGLVGVEVKFDEDNTKAAALLQNYELKYGEAAPFPAFMAAAYDNVYLIKDAIEANDGVVDADQIRDYLYAVEDYNGALGSITIDENGDPILQFDVKKVVSGNLVVIR